MTALAKIIPTGQTIRKINTTASNSSGRFALRFVCFMECYPLLAPQIWLIFAASSLASAIILSQSGVI